MALLIAELEGAEIPYENRRSIALGDDNIAHLLEGLDETDAADDVAKFAAREHTSAGVRAVGLNGVSDVLERKVETQELGWVEFELELRRDTAKIGDVGDPRHLLERGNNRPTLDFGKLTQVLRIGFERVAVDFADRRCQRVEARRDSRRQLTFWMRSRMRWRDQ